MNLSRLWQVFLVLIPTEMELIKRSGKKYDEESFNC